MNVVHLCYTYCNVTFIHYTISNLKINNHFVVCRKMKNLNIFPYDKVFRTHKIFDFIHLINTIWVSKFKRNRILLNDWIANYMTIKKLPDIDILHTHFGDHAYYMIPLAKKLGKPLVVTFYGGDMSDVAKKAGWRERYGQLFSFADLVLCEGSYMRSKIIELGCSAEKIKVSKISIPIETITFNFRPTYNENEKLKILMCASFVPKKGFFDAINAIYKLKSEGVNIDCKIIGDGPLRDKICRMITSLGLIDDIQLLGKLKPSIVYEYAKEAHFFLHPSKFAPDGGSEGGAPTIIIQMQAAGLPIISTTHADIPNIIPKENHFLSEEGNVDDIVNNIKLLISQQDNWINISLRGRKFVEQEHSTKTCSILLEKMYESIFKYK